MVTNNFALYSVKILAECGRDLLMFPVWWYGRGLLGLIENLIQFLKNRQKSLALIVWIKNLFRPMYGQRDWQGKLISFFMRLAQIIFRSMLMFFYLLIAILVFIFWIILPIFVIYEIIYQING
ncbi:hypothetical protein DRH27_00955 [Candidatus Falkowbacteria bacterium]|nr:MAG: hypothetical protein DRH27_00955 [Candidatus Falkowbacteria bacterium]